MAAHRVTPRPAGTLADAPPLDTAGRSAPGEKASGRLLAGIFLVSLAMILHEILLIHAEGQMPPRDLRHPRIKRHHQFARRAFVAIREPGCDCVAEFRNHGERGRSRGRCAK